MVSLRCKMVVKDALNNLKLHYRNIDLGEVDLIENTITTEQYNQLKKVLKISGLELMDETKSILVERTKNLIVQMVHYSDELLKVKTSEYISEQLQHDYTYLSNLFKEVTGITIQQYILLHKIEKAKELILYDELSLSEIADKLNYSSVAYLSSQFKKMTGLTPTYFRKIQDYKKRVMLETI